MSMSFRKNGRSIGLVAGGLVAGAVLAGAFAANAADNTSTASPSPSSSSSSNSTSDRPTNPNPGDPSKPQRSDETLLTGSTAQSVKDAVLAKYPGATFVRVETDSDGVYEAHITKADGSPATVQLDKTFAVTGEDAGGGHGGPGGHGGRGHDGPGRPGDNDADDQAPAASSANPEAATQAS